jgi:hypothetical protein
MPEPPETLEIVGGPRIEVPWTKNMTEQQVPEAAYDDQNQPGSLQFTLRERCVRASHPEPELMRIVSLHPRMMA